MTNLKTLTKYFISLVLVFSFSIELTNQQITNEDTKTILNLKKTLNLKKNTYLDMKLPEKNSTNSTRLTEYTKSENISIFLNKTNFLNFKRSHSIQKSLGINELFITKYFINIFSRFSFNEIIKKNLDPELKKLTESYKETWRNYEFLYKNPSENSTYYVTILARKNLISKKYDVLINQIEINYDVEDSIFFKVNLLVDFKNILEEKKILQLNSNKFIKDYILEAISDILSSDSIDNIVNLFDIKPNEKGNMKFLSE